MFFVYKLKINPYTGLMADRDFEISDDLPNLDDLILEGEIELVSSWLLYDFPRPRIERWTSGESGNSRKKFPLDNTTKATEW